VTNIIPRRFIEGMSCRKQILTTRVGMGLLNPFGKHMIELLLQQHLVIMGIVVVHFQQRRRRRRRRLKKKKKNKNPGLVPSIILLG
jgi:hypothetical protein